MRITRRHALGGAAAAATGALIAPRVASALTAGKPFAGKEIKVLAVQSTQFAAHAKKVAAFTEQTGIKVTFVFVPFGALRERLTAEMVGGSDDFDIITAMDVWIPPLVDKYLAPLDKELAGRKIELARYPEPFVAAGKFPSGVYGVPVRCHIQLLWYRKDLFDKAGLQPPKTWDEMVTAGKTVQDQNPGIAGVTIPYGKADGQNLMVWYNFLWGAGGDLFDANMKPIFNSAAGVKATQDFTDIILKHKITPAGAASFNEAELDDLFLPGQGSDGAGVVARLQPPQPARRRREGRPGRLRAAAVLPGQGLDDLHERLDLRRERQVQEPRRGHGVHRIHQRCRYRAFDPR